MRASELKARTWDENLLFSALIELTYRCNLDCYFCYNDVGLKGRPLSLEQYELLLVDLAELGVFDLVLSGGEPLAHPNFFEIGSKARELGFVVRIKSNGHALGGGLAARVKQEIDPFKVDVSLHGATAETHDRQTRVAGSFDKLISNLTEMKSSGLRVKLNATLTRWNEHELEAMFDLADQHGLSLKMSPTVTPRDDGDTDPLSIAPSAVALRELFRQRYRGEPMEAAPPTPDSYTPRKNCGAGSSTIAIDPYGSVFPCVQWRRSIGNLHERSIKAIWAGSEDLEEIRRLTTEAKNKKDQLGRLGSRLDFCPGLSEMKTGDPLEIEPDAQRTAEVLDEFLESRSESLLPVLE